MEPASTPAGRRAKLRLPTYIKITATELSLTSRKNPASAAQAGKPASAWATTTTTPGTISSAAFGDTTFCFTTMATGHLPTSREKQASTTKKSAGEPVAHGSITTATAFSTSSSATTSSSILKTRRHQPSRLSVSG